MNKPISPGAYTPSAEALQRIGGLAVRLDGLVSHEYADDQALVHAFIQRRHGHTSCAIARHEAVDMLEQILVDGILLGTVTGKAAKMAEAYFANLRFVKECDGDFFVDPDSHVDDDGTIVFHAVRSEVTKPIRNKLAEARKAKGLKKRRRAPKAKP